MGILSAFYQPNTQVEKDSYCYIRRVAEQLMEQGPYSLQILYITLATIFKVEFKLLNLPEACWCTYRSRCGAQNVEPLYLCFIPGSWLILYTQDQAKELAAQEAGQPMELIAESRTTVLKEKKEMIAKLLVHIKQELALILHATSGERKQTLLTRLLESLLQVAENGSNISADNDTASFQKLMKLSKGLLNNQQLVNSLATIFNLKKEPQPQPERTLSAPTGLELDNLQGAAEGRCTICRQNHLIVQRRFASCLPNCSLSYSLNCLKDYLACAAVCPACQTVISPEERARVVNSSPAQGTLLTNHNHEHTFSSALPSPSSSPPITTKAEEILCDCCHTSKHALRLACGHAVCERCTRE